MRNKTIISVIVLALIIPTELLADAFPKIPESLGGGGPAFSVELLGSFEREFNNGHSLLAWGGMAALLAPVGLDISAGPELALEYRYYFHQRENIQWSFSLYTGMAYNLVGEHYGAFTPGWKITRKKSVSRLFQLEPYISLSYPFYFDGSRPLLPTLTFGYRFVFEKKTHAGGQR